jgi:hypothetical protein
MNGHFATRSLNEDGSWKDLTAQKNISSDISPTAGQMPRLLGLAQASKIYKSVKLKVLKSFQRRKRNCFRNNWGCFYSRRSFLGNFECGLCASGSYGSFDLG